MQKTTITHLFFILTFFGSFWGDDECSDYQKIKFAFFMATKDEAPDKWCVFLNDECKEQYVDCELYKGKNAS